ncbi:interleukin-1 receptor-associated kinase 1-binding protein 1 isoform X3 [Haliaeetus albicilla]|uniref:interleukin-1 receptor-associated kinase 1-binding protein 1 isoform X3 n=1 Tax=Haliaeetus albicilla TaxID=8969 RepID=UPI0037E76985
MLHDKLEDLSLCRKYSDAKHLLKCVDTENKYCFPVQINLEENMTVTEDFSRVENTYQMEAEVCIIFSDFGKMQNVCNLLIEKLGTSVTISPPHFYHTPEAVDTLRRQVCVAAVGNTRRKAQEVCRLFGQSLGKPLLIKEEETKEWGGHIDSHLSNSPDSLTLQERIQNATAYASCRVFAVFEIKGKENRRHKLL